MAQQSDKQAFVAEFNRIALAFSEAQAELLHLIHNLITFQQRENAKFCLDIANLVDEDWWKGNDIDKAANKTRRIGRNLISHVINSPDMVKENEAFFLSRGYAEIVNVYSITAPLDAINWKHMKKYTEMPALASWAVVMATGIEAEDIHPTLMNLVKEVTTRFIEGKLEKDPFPRDTLNKMIFSDQTVVPERLKQHLPKLSAYIVGPAPQVAIDTIK